MAYPYTLTEDYVNRMYRSIGIFHPHQLNLEKIAARNGISIFYRPAEPMNIGDAIILDSRVSRKERWQDFGHELCHVLWHAGNQITMPMPYQVYQESKSNNFAQYACIPTFMLNELVLPTHERDGILMIQELFNVEWEFAEKRLRKHVDKLYCR